MTENTGSAPIALFGHMKTVYDEMVAQANIVHSEDVDMLIYEGKLTELVTDHCGLPVPQYTRVTQALKGMSCAKQLRRGGGNSPSQWLLIEEPTIEAFDVYIESLVSKDQKEPEYATIQSITDLNNRVQRLEKAIGV